MRKIGILFIFLTCFYESAKADPVTNGRFIQKSFMTYDSNYLSPTSLFKDAVCSPSQSDPHYAGVAKLLLENLHSFAEELDSTFEDIEGLLDLNVYNSFQELKLAAMAQNPTAQSLNTAISNFENHLKNSAEADSMKFTNWSAKILAKYASQQTLQTLFSDLGSVKVSIEDIMNFSYLIEEDHLYTIFKLYKGFEYSTPSQLSLVEHINFYANKAPGELRSESFRILLQNTYITTRANKIRLRAQGNSDSSSDRNATRWDEDDDVLRQLLAWSRNPQAQICQRAVKAPPPLMDWCVANDLEFLMHLEAVANQANETARDMKMGLHDSFIRGGVAITGAYCTIDGYYHLIKTGPNEVTLNTSGNLLVKKINSKEKFHESDLIASLKTKHPDFKTERKSKIK